MDDIVQQAMAKWPNVPAVFGWLSLSRRGEWRIKGERISNPIVTEFINRNYTHDDQGRWFFQNGPQRVYVSLDYTPMVYRIADATSIENHMGSRVTNFKNAYIDDGGSLLLNTELGIGVVDDRDLDTFLLLLADRQGQPLTQGALERLSSLAPQHWRDLRLIIDGKTLIVKILPAETVPKHFAYQQSPIQPAGDEAC